MSTAADLRRLALAMPGTTEAPHFDRAAFKVARIYVTLSPDQQTANFMLTPDEQAFKCMLLPEALAPVPNKWGEKGATTATLANLSNDDLQALIDMAHTHALPKKRK